MNNNGNDASDRYDGSSDNEIGIYLRKNQSPYQQIQVNSEKISVGAWKVVAILSLIATMVTYAETMLIPAIPDLYPRLSCFIQCLILADNHVSVSRCGYDSYCWEIIRHIW